MHEALNDLGRCLQQFLGNMLPTGGPQWWENAVLAQLTFPQRRIVDEKGISALEELDLAGLLRVLDQNWHDINSSRNR